MGKMSPQVLASIARAFRTHVDAAQDLPRSAQWSEVGRGSWTLFVWEEDGRIREGEEREEREGAFISFRPEALI